MELCLIGWQEPQWVGQGSLEVTVSVFHCVFLY